MTAMTSAIMPSAMTCGSAWHAKNDGGRILIRHGRFGPSEASVMAQLLVALGVSPARILKNGVQPRQEMG